jgi:hypothetical protein
MKRIIAFVILVAACIPAQAQKTPAAIQAEINASTAAGRAGGTILTDITQSFLSLTDGGTLSSGLTVNAGITGQLYVTTSGAGGYEINRRDTSAPAATWYSASGNVQLFSFATGADISNFNTTTGVLNTTGGFSTAGAAGATVTTTVRNSGGLGTCTLIFAGGLNLGTGTC